MSDTPDTAPSEVYASAVKALADIYRAFGLAVPEAPEESALFSLLLEGRIVYDPRGESVEYRLLAPIDYKDDKGRLEVVAFREASASELEYIRAGSRVRGDKSVDLGDLASMTLRVLVKVAGVPTGIVNRFKARDVDELCSIFSDLGFFGR